MADCDLGAAGAQPICYSWAGLWARIRAESRLGLVVGRDRRENTGKGRAGVWSARVSIWSRLVVGVRAEESRVEEVWRYGIGEKDRCTGRDSGRVRGRQ